ncbi:universal stress protein [Companilactobacillus sp. HBUAS56275]|uniref:Universal stress protein n=1 Tax=Candidatus Companilactobacillus pullicola TaxID=2838523 RepID=A0A9D2CPU8_9LACO|nr:universal stress protein [Candidatus Companilactobacillus pullicola]
MFNRILVAIDGSKNSYDALEAAMDLTKKFNSELYLVSVVNTANLPVSVGVSYVPGLTDELETGAKVDLQKAEEMVKGAGLACHVELLNGEPRSELANFPKDKEIDLIIMGKTGLNALERAFVGSVTRYVSEHSKTNVLIVN